MFYTFKSSGITWSISYPKDLTAFRVSSVSVLVPAIFAKSFALQQIGCATVCPYWFLISIVIFILFSLVLCIRPLAGFRLLKPLQLCFNCIKSNWSLRALIALISLKRCSSHATATSPIVKPSGNGSHCLNVKRKLALSVHPMRAEAWSRSVAFNCSNNVFMVFPLCV